jgi:Ca2+-binding RTX toxin-like protein
LPGGSTSPRASARRCQGPATGSGSSPTRSETDTWLFAEENDNGRLDATDFTVRFESLHDFTEDDFVGTAFVTVGTAGDDVITGTEEADTVFAGGGNDQVFGLVGDDELNGGSGADTLDGGPGSFDTLNGDAGDDTLTLATSDIGGVASGGVGNDTLLGSDVEFAFSDLQGGEGSDALHAGAAATTMDGGAGADQLFSGAGDDQMTGGRDESFLLDGAEDFFVYGSGDWGSDILFGFLFGFKDGVDRFDLRGSGLAFDDLEIVNQEFQATISSTRGTITKVESFGEPIEITPADFMFV